MAPPLRGLILMVVAIRGIASIEASSITYYPGKLAILLSAPHGGAQKPSEIPDRTHGCWNNIMNKCIWSHGCGRTNSRRCQVKTFADARTKQLALTVRRELKQLTGEFPHVVINELHRSKMDANRPEMEATLDVQAAKEAWTKYHAEIERFRMSHSMSNGLVLDIHGFSLPAGFPGYIMLGYLISRNKLQSGSYSSMKTSIKALIERKGNGVLRGNSSLGAYLVAEGYTAVPSNATHYPDEETFPKYYTGGYITRRYGSRNGSGKVDAIQIEAPYNLRSSNVNVKAFGKKLAHAINEFYKQNYM